MKPIRTRRQALGLSQHRLAELAGLPTSDLRTIEAGKPCGITEYRAIDETLKRLEKQTLDRAAEIMKKGHA